MEVRIELQRPFESLARRSLLALRKRHPPEAVMPCWILWVDSCHSLRHIMGIRKLPEVLEHLRVVETHINPGFRKLHSLTKLLPGSLPPLESNIDLAEIS